MVSMRWNFGAIALKSIWSCRSKGSFLQSVSMKDGVCKIIWMKIKRSSFGNSFFMVPNRHQKAISSKDLIGSSDHGNILKNNMF